MKQIINKILTVSLFCTVFSITALAQNSKKVSRVAETYVITAKAGGVNFVSGNVSVVRHNGAKISLVKGGVLEKGDRVKSSADGKAEILLNPGSFVRLAENSEMEFISNSLDDLQVKVTSGSAIFEVVATKDFNVRVVTPKSGFSIAKSGVYRVDVATDGIAAVEVWKGKIQLNGNPKAIIVKEGQTIALASGQTTAVKFNRDDKDNFELWSKDRAKELAKLNAALVNRQMNRSLVAYSRSFGLSSGFGLWIQDPLSRNFMFLPYSYGYNSPYGYGYNRSVWGYSWANNYNNSYNSQGQWSNPQNNGNSISSPSVSSGAPARDFSPSPQMQQAPGGIIDRKAGPID